MVLQPTHFHPYATVKKLHRLESASAGMTLRSDDSHK